MHRFLSCSPTTVVWWLPGRRFTSFKERRWPDGYQYKALWIFSKIHFKLWLPCLGWFVLHNSMLVWQQWTQHWVNNSSCLITHCKKKNLYRDCTVGCIRKMSYIVIGKSQAPLLKRTKIILFSQTVRIGEKTKLWNLQLFINISFYLSIKVTETLLKTHSIESIVKIVECIGSKPQAGDWQHKSLEEKEKQSLS